MFGKQLERVKKRTRDLKEQVEENERCEKNLTGRLQGELEYFLEQNTDAKLVEVSHQGALTIYFPRQVKLESAANSDTTVVYVNGTVVCRYYHVTQSFFEYSNSPVHIEEQVRHIFIDLMTLWKYAVATRDYESFECTRTLRWIAQQLPRDTQWPDIVAGYVATVIEQNEK